MNSSVVWQCIIRTLSDDIAFTTEESSFLGDVMMMRTRSGAYVTDAGHRDRSLLRRRNGNLSRTEELMCFTCLQIRNASIEPSRLVFSHPSHTLNIQTTLTNSPIVTTSCSVDN